MREKLALQRLDEKQTQWFCLTLKRDDGSRAKCQFCDEEAVEGIPIYDPSEISLPGMDHATGAYYPLRIGLHGVLLRCEACRDADKGKGGIFYHDTYGKWFKVRCESWGAEKYRGMHKSRRDRRFCGISVVGTY